MELQENHWLVLQSHHARLLSCRCTEKAPVPNECNMHGSTAYVLHIATIAIVLHCYIHCSSPVIYCTMTIKDATLQTPGRGFPVKTCRQTSIMTCYIMNYIALGLRASHCLHTLCKWASNLSSLCLHIAKQTCLDESKGNMLHKTTQSRSTSSRF